MNEPASSSKGPSIASLLPSSTEICDVLGLGEHLVGRSHECDFPSVVTGLPVLTRATVDSQAGSREIDRQVRSQLTEGLSLYQVEEKRLQALAPDLVITQDTCDLCAVSFATVQESVRRLLGPTTQIVSLSPVSVDDVLDDHQRVADAVGISETGERCVSQLRQALDELQRLTADLEKPRTVILEWLDPPMTGGHWTPELLRMAGADPVLCHEQTPTRAGTWEEIAEADPDVLLLAPCGFPIAQTERELPELFKQPIFAQLRAVRSGAVYVIDGNHYFNRPGPRLVESARIAARILHPEATRDLTIPEASWRAVVSVG